MLFCTVLNVMQLAAKTPMRRSSVMFCLSVFLSFPLVVLSIGITPAIAFDLGVLSESSSSLVAGGAVLISIVGNGLLQALIPRSDLSADREPWCCYLTGR